MTDSTFHRLHDEERLLLTRLRHLRRQPPSDPAEAYTVGERVADKVAAAMGSWKFIIIQSITLAIWIVLNITAWMQHWDPYPFILLNLALSFQAAYAAPFIMMSQNRQASIDRRDAKTDYDVNIKAELEIELLHEKIDKMREDQISRLLTVVEDLSSKLAEIATTKT
ncbi:DUF1003 domain-containing protein [Acidisoma silvae]|uniref:DUF1003 domain-containing protein n=1 Tax=Acidisoma silvae TaxID=2802396 RepID=A0A964DY70_9PROT|nr:DUF1003 domain-containing protein [Acidisoma silvae]MCB8874619.1 DUF1003 domain-containing protein [Acidisoma silvae]